MDLNSKYNNAAPDWAQTVAELGYDAAYADFLHPHAQPTGPVLDAGCGTAAFARAWIKAGGSHDLTLLDPSPAMLDRARATAQTLGLHPKLACTTIDDHVPSALYHTILAAHVVEHSATPETTFRRFSDWLEPQGQLFVVASKPHWCNWVIWLRFRHRRFSAGQVLHFAQTADLHHRLTHRFSSGPPSRTSLGYLFTKP